MELTEKDQKLLKMIDDAVENELKMAKAMGYDMPREEAVANVEEFITMIRNAKQEKAE